MSIRANFGPNPGPRSITNIERSFAALVMLTCAAAYWTLLLTIHTRGYASAADLDLWGRTLMATEGLTSVESVATTYPPLAFIGTIGVGWLFPGLGLTAPKVLGVTLAAFLVAGWFAAILRNGLHLGATLLCTAALALNPLFLRALSEGPSFIFLLGGVWLTALGTFGLRRAHRVNDIIMVSIGLAIIAFSHPLGILLVFSSIPFLALVVPTDRLRDAPASMMMVLFFPALFAILSFFYVNWILSEGPLAFWDTLSRESASLGGASLHGGTSAKEIALALFGVIAVCPMGVALYARARGMAPLRFAIGAQLGSLLATSLLASLLGVLPSITLALSLVCPIAAAAAARWPSAQSERPDLTVLMVGGLVGGIIISLIDPSFETQRWRNALLDREIAPYNAELRHIAKTLQSRDDVLFDADAAPAVIAERGSARGIWSSSTEEFRLAGMQQRTDAKTLVVQNRAVSLGNDRVSRVFPALYDEGLPGYERIYDSEQWRIYALRTEPNDD